MCIVDEDNEAIAVWKAAIDTYVLSCFESDDQYCNPGEVGGDPDQSVRGAENIEDALTIIVKRAPFNHVNDRH